MSASSRFPLQESSHPMAWTHVDSESLYNVTNWGRGYFRVNPAGNLEATPEGGVHLRRPPGPLGRSRAPASGRDDP